jgi:hypothetical protein
VVGKRERRWLATAKTRCSGVGTVEMIDIEVRRSGMDWIDLAQHRDQWQACCYEYPNEPLGSIKCCENLQ